MSLVTLDKNSLLLISFVKDDCRTIGTLSIFANAVVAGIDTKLLYINTNFPPSRNKLKEFLNGHLFWFIGISLTTFDYYYAIKVTNIIREIFPETFLFWGGIHPTCLPEESLENSINCIFIGEGEEGIVELIRVHNAGGDISQIKGVGVRRGRGEYILNSPGYIENIDTLHFPYYDFNNIYLLDDTDIKIRHFTLNDYKRYSRHAGDGYTLITMRSCPHRCSYCINSYLNKIYEKKKMFRRRSVKNIVEEIKYALQTIPSVKFINFMDDHFLINEDWLGEFYEVYPREIDLPFIIRGTPESITERHIEKLKNCGLQVVQMGIQSASKRTHKEIFHRNYSRSSILAAAEVLHKYNIKGMYDFIIGNEFETDAEKEQTIHLMMELPKPYKASVFHIIAFPKTDIIEYYESNNIKPRLDPYKTNYFDFTADDFFANLAKVVPYVNNEKIQYYLDNKTDQEIRNEVFSIANTLNLDDN